MLETRGRTGVVAAAGLSMLLLVIALNAWVSDDAYITFRTIDNFVHGYGLRWNVDQRVQAYTHPLWLFVITPFYRLTGEPYFTSIAISIALSIAAALVLVSTIATSSRVAALALLTLSFSKAFVDYSTSGLENPLTHVLLASFLACWFRIGATKAHVGVLALLAALVMLNRLDAGLLVLPALAAAAWTTRGWLRAAAGLLPLVVWEAFSIVYYGFPVPNTAYAKLSTGIAARELIPHGVEYLRNSLTVDPLTVTAIAVIAIAAIVLRQRHTWPLFAGIALHLGYIVRVGGAFMSGRFLAAPLFGALIAACQFDAALGVLQMGAIGSTVVVLGLLAAPPTVWPGASPARIVVPPSGIADERLYYSRTGLLRTLADASWRPAPPDNGDLAARARHRPILVVGSAGLAGFGAGPGVHVIDTYALADPLLARLPAKPRWRIGHYERDLPAGTTARSRAV